MSRVGLAPIEIPSGVDVSADAATVDVKGPLGELSQSIPDGIVVTVGDGHAQVARADDTRRQRSLHGLTRSLVANMVHGVAQGFSKELRIVGVGYRATPKGDDALELSLGFSHTVAVKAPPGITFSVPTATSVTVTGIDKQLVGQVAANIRALRKPEPYKGKGIRYVDEHVIRKAGKAAK
ncbi:MAG TPA: 50S ribosomal protein L6 [Acidimicrobiaceae bacterium]|nr:50S ribosomal protein L6 [Acidimicrobiaceae bacterium]HCB37026.1 50S ribosomal protein L6 [Acidimicrobiaceae bacterium]